MVATGGGGSGGDSDSEIQRSGACSGKDSREMTNGKAAKLSGG